MTYKSGFTILYLYGGAISYWDSNTIFYSMKKTIFTSIRNPGLYRIGRGCQGNRLQDGKISIYTIHAKMHSLYKNGAILRNVYETFYLLYRGYRYYRTH
jgi:hypothetical protein